MFKKDQKTDTGVTFIGNLPPESIPTNTSLAALVNLQTDKVKRDLSTLSKKKKSERDEAVNLQSELEGKEDLDEQQANQLAALNTTVIRLTNEVIPFDYTVRIYDLTTKKNRKPNETVVLEKIRGELKRLPHISDKVKMELRFYWDIIDKHSGDKPLGI
jgi:hypothetical protein